VYMIEGSGAALAATIEGSGAALAATCIHAG
jgi:hypothetical protein